MTQSTVQLIAGILAVVLIVIIIMRRKNKKKPRAKVKAVRAPTTPRQHKTAIDRLMMLIRQVHRWLPERLVVLVVDGGYAAVKLALVCAATPNLALVTRLRWDASLYHPPPASAAGQRGPTPSKGARQRSLKQWAARRDRPWEEVEVAWYGGQKKKLQLFARTALWYTPGEAPVAIRYVLTRDPEGHGRDARLRLHQTRRHARPDHGVGGDALVGRNDV